MKRHFKKLTAFVLVAAMLAAVLPIIAFNASAQTSKIWIDKKVDPSTMDSWRELFPADNTTQAGRVWTDKSVFANADKFQNLKDALGNDTSIKMLDETNNFLIALSTLASNKSIVGYSYTPTDTILVLDASDSMDQNGYVTQLVKSANDAIVKLLNLNKHNRVGVVLYSGSTSQGNSRGDTAEVILPLGRYEQGNATEQGVFFVTNNAQSFIEINEDVFLVEGDKRTKVDVERKDVHGGTYIQNGVYMAMQELLKADTIIPEGEIQAGTTRTPIVVLMSDGAPTTATSDFAGLNRNNNTVGIGTSNLGDGTAPGEVLDDVIDFVNQLTAAYVKERIAEHYVNADPLFYTLGLGRNTALNSAVLNPDGFANTDEYWEEYVALRNNSRLILDIEESGGGSVDTTSITKIAQISSVEQKNYATDYFPAQNNSDLEAAFEQIVNQIIIQSLYYPTLVNENTHDHDGFVEFIDDIGHYMEVKEIKGIMIGDTLFTGKYLAENFNEQSDAFFDKNGNYTELANNVVWSVMERIGIDDVVEARDLINSAYEAKQLYYDAQTGDWSNFIGWYADDNGNYMGHWHAGHTAEDIPEKNGVKATYINRSYGMLGQIKDDYVQTDLMYISTQVHTRISDGHCSLIWKIPASLIPVVSYKVTLNAEKLEDATEASIEYDAQEPISILFEVGLFDEINKANISEIITDPQNHVDSTDPGKYYLHTNWWKGANISHEHFDRENDTIVFFEPSQENERYYYTETTPVLIKDGNDYIRYTGAQPQENDGNTYYRLYYVFNGTSIVKMPEQMSVETIKKASAGENGTWNIPAGTVHRFFEPFNLEKDPNETKSLDYVRYPVVEEIPGEAGKFYVGSLLGNNGLLTVEIPQGLKISKKVDDTLYGTDEIFKFNITADGITGQYELYKQKADGTWKTTDTITFTNGTTSVELAAGETAYIMGLPENVNYTVKEIINGDYAVSAIKIDGIEQTDLTQAEVLVKTDTLTEAEFTNTLVVNDGTIVVSKEVTHDPALTYNNNLEFTFRLYKTGEYNENDSSTYTEFTLKAGESRTFNNANAGIVPGSYTVEEVIIPDGFTADATNNKITKDVANGSASAYAFHFVNVYEPEDIKPVNLVVSGTKEIDGRAWREGDKFTFALQYYSVNGWQELATRTVAYNDAQNYDYKFDFANDTDLTSFALDKLGTHYFRVIEKIPADNEKLGGMTYSDSPRYFHVVVTDETMDGALEIKEIVGTNATVNGANVVADFTNVYAATKGDDITITINKTVNNDKAGTQLSPEGFVFGIFTVGGTTPLAVSEPTDANGNTSITLTFPATAAGKSYDFEVREIVPEGVANGLINGMEYDATPRPITITIIDNLDGTTTAKIGTADGITQDYENKYIPKDVAVSLEGTKVMDGRNFDDNEFEFVLADKEGSANDGDDLTTEKTVGHESKVDGGKIDFGKITFSKVGTYKYTISEVIPAENDKLGGVEYSTKVYDVEIIVSDNADNDGKLDAVVKVNGDTVNGSTADTIVFENIYTAEEAEVTLEATKNLIGRDLTANDDFKFDLYSANDQFVKGNVLYDDVKLVIDAQDAKKGLIKFEKMTFGTEGDWYFVAVEDGENGKGITVDKTEYKIHINVEDNQKGQLVATVKVNGTAVTGSTKNAIVFNNTYAAKGSVQIVVEKELTGRELAKDEFSFELYDENGAKKETVKNDADGKVKFTAIEIDSAGKKVYTVKEVKANDATITYDDAVYTVEVTAIDNGDGTFTVSQKFFDANEDEITKIVFENTYTPPIKPPVTGDTVNPLLLAVLIISTVGLVTVVYNKKKRV